MACTVPVIVPPGASEMLSVVTPDAASVTGFVPDATTPGPLASTFAAPGSRPVIEYVPVAVVVVPSGPAESVTTTLAPATGLLSWSW